MDIEMLKTIAQEVQNELARVYELYDLGEPPSVTPGIVDMVLRVAEQHEPPAPATMGAESRQAKLEATESYLREAEWEL
jgi:hypothetical protein